MNCDLLPRNKAFLCAEDIRPVVRESETSMLWENAARLLGLQTRRDEFLDHSLGSQNGAQPANETLKQPANQCVKVGHNFWHTGFCYSNGGRKR